jgi:two-component system CheB/CheR fusion protein
MDNQRVLSMFLTRAGAVVHLAANGQEAIDSVQAAQQAAQPFHVVLMDMQMPVMDGFEATRRLRASGYDLPIVALTAAHEGQQRCIEAGCCDHLLKPIDSRVLVKSCEQWIAASLSSSLSKGAPSFEGDSATAR